MFRFFVFLLVVACVSINSIIYNFSLIELAISFLVGVLTYLYMSKMTNLQDNLASLLLFVYIILSTTFCATIQIDDKKYSYEDFTQLALFSNHLMLLFLASSLFVHGLKLKNISSQVEFDVQSEYVYTMYSARYVWTLLAIAISLTLFSKVIGLGVMGREAVELPFKLGGLIMYMRKSIIPYLFLLVYIKNQGDPNLRKYFVVYVLWALLECFVMLSKGILVSNLLPIIIYILLKNNGFRRQHIINLLGLLFVFILLYPIIGNLRYVKNTKSFQESIRAAEEMKIDSNEDGNALKAPFLRTFTTGTYYMNALPYIKSSEGVLFDFSRFPVIASMGGSAVYTTLVIEGFKKGVHHSSGTTGIVDPLLLGGYGFAYSVVLLLVLLASVIDAEYMKCRLALKVFLLLWFFDLVRGYTISRFLDPLAPSFVLTTIFLICYLNHESLKRIE